MNEYPKSLREYNARARTITLQFLNQNYECICNYPNFNYPNFLMIAPLEMVNGIPAIVPIARDIPIVSFVDPKSSRNQNRYASRKPQIEPHMKNTIRNIRMCGLIISLPKFWKHVVNNNVIQVIHTLNTFLAGFLKLRFNFRMRAALISLIMKKV